MNTTGGREEGFVALLCGILEHEQGPTACMHGGALSNAVLRMTELIFRGFSFHSIQQVRAQGRMRACNACRRQST